MWDYVPLLFEGLCSRFYLTLNGTSRLCVLGFALVTVVHSVTVGISLLDPHCLLRVQYCCYQFSCIVTDWICGTMFPLLFDIKRYEQTLRPGLCLSDSHMIVVHNFTVGISLLDPYCLVWVQYCFYQFSCIVADWVCGIMSPFIITSSVLLLLVQVLALMLWMSFLGVQYFGEYHFVWLCDIYLTHSSGCRFLKDLNLCQVWHCL